MRLCTLAAMISFAVCRGCGCLGFCVEGVTVGVVTMRFMGASSSAFAVAFHAMRGMYLHAERLLAKAGRQGATRRGIAHPKDKRSAGIFRRKIMWRPLAPRQGSALSEAWFPYLRASARLISGPALRAGHRPAEILSRLSRLFFSL